MGACGGRVADVTAISVLVNTVAETDGTSAGCFAQGSSRHELVDLISGRREPLTDWADVAVSRDGRYAAWTEFGDRTRFVVVDVSTGDRVLEADPFTRSQSYALMRELNGDGSLLLYGDLPMEVWDVSTGEVVATFGVGLGESQRAGFGPSGDTVYAAGRDSTVREFDARTGEQIFALPAASGGRPVPTEGGSVLVLDESTSTASIAEQGARGETGTIKSCAGFVYAESLDVAGGLASFADQCGDDTTGSEIVVDLANMNLVRSTPGANDAQASALSPDGSRLAAQETDPDRVKSPIRITDAKTGALVTELAGMCSWDVDSTVPREEQMPCKPFPETPFPFTSWRIRWSYDGAMLAAIDDFPADQGGGYLAVWDTRTGELIHEEAAPSGQSFWDAIFTPDGTRMITSTGQGELREYSTETWALDQRAAGDASGDDRGLLAFAGFLADRSTLVAVSGLGGLGGGFLHRIDSQTLTILSSNRAHDGSPKSMAMSPDASLVATGASDGLVRVWDAPTGALLHQLAVDGQAQGVAFIDNQHLAVTPFGGSLLIFTLDPQELVKIVRSSLTRGLTGAECQRFGFDPCPSLEEMAAGTS